MVLMGLCSKGQTLLSCSPPKERSSQELQHAELSMLMNVLHAKACKAGSDAACKSTCPTWPPFTV